MEVQGEKRDEDAATPEFKSGLTYRSLIGLLYALAVFSPTLVWLSLVTIGVYLGGAVQFCTLLILVEYARLSGKPLRKQEAFVAFLLGIFAETTWPLTMIYREYFRLHPYPKQFGITPYVPDWWAPPPESGVWNLRTFFNEAWLTPIAIHMIFMTLATIGGLFFGLFLREMYIENERLPFPMVQINAVAITTLTERKRESISLMTGVAVLSMVYAAILYTVPTIAGALGYTIKVLPIPWVDSYLFLQRVLPGAAFGVATDAAIFGQGIFLPFKVVSGMVIGSVFVFLIMNPLLVNLGLTLWAKRYVPGMDMQTVWRESTLTFWVSPLIGVGFAMGFVPLILRSKVVIQTFKSIFRPTSRSVQRVSGERFSSLFMLSLFLIGGLGLVILDTWLIPGFPIWIFVLYETVFPFILGTVNGRIIGVTGYEIGFPYLREILILGSGYQKYDIWFLPLAPHPGTGWLQTLKLAQLTETKPSSVLKAYFLTLPFVLFFSLILVQSFWQLAPIPSAMYPAPAINWPISIIYEALWITRPAGLFSFEIIAYSLILTSALIVIFEFLHIPIQIVSIIAGLYMPIPITITILIGALAGKIIAKMKGEEWFNSNKGIIAAGIGIGEGVAIVIGVAAALVFRASWFGPR